MINFSQLGIFGHFHREINSSEKPVCYSGVGTLLGAGNISLGKFAGLRWDFVQFSALSGNTNPIMDMSWDFEMSFYWT